MIVACSPSLLEAEIALLFRVGCGLIGMNQFEIVWSDEMSM